MKSIQSIALLTAYAVYLFADVSLARLNLSNASTSVIINTGTVSDDNYKNLPPQGQHPEYPHPDHLQQSHMPPVQASRPQPSNNDDEREVFDSPTEALNYKLDKIESLHTKIKNKIKLILCTFTGVGAIIYAYLSCIANREVINHLNTGGDLVDLKMSPEAEKSITFSRYSYLAVIIIYAIGFFMLNKSLLGDNEKVKNYQSQLNTIMHDVEESETDPAILSKFEERVKECEKIDTNNNFMDTSYFSDTFRKSFLFAIPPILIGSLKTDFFLQNFIAWMLFFSLIHFIVKSIVKFLYGFASGFLLKEE